MKFAAFADPQETVNHMIAIEIPKIEGLRIELAPPDTLRLKGTITKKDVVGVESS